MSFSSDVKKEICQKPPEKKCCILAETYGFMAACKKNLELHTENNQAARRFAEDLLICASVIVDIQTNLTSQSGKVNITVRMPNENDICTVNQLFSGFNPESICCMESFLKGAFLAGGTVANPQKEYHLEFSAAEKFYAQKILLCLQQLDLSPAMMVRKNYYVVYIKGSQQIEDLLGHLGALEAYWHFFDITVEKEIRNNANRRANCDSANISKTVDASSRQINAIKKIIEKIGLEKLPEELREIAAVRMENPELSLREIGQELQEPISRSGVNHRLKRIMDIAQDL